MTDDGRLIIRGVGGNHLEGYSLIVDAVSSTGGVVVIAGEVRPPWTGQSPVRVQIEHGPELAVTSTEYGTAGRFKLEVSGELSAADVVGVHLGSAWSIFEVLA